MNSFLELETLRAQLNEAVRRRGGQLLDPHVLHVSRALDAQVVGYYRATGHSPAGAGQGAKSERHSDFH